MNKSHGKVIFLNGTSSSGKSTLARGLQESLGQAYLHVTVDAFLHQLSDTYLADRAYLSEAFPTLLAGFNASTAAIARAGNNVIVDHVLQEPSWVAPFVEAFDGLRVVFVGVCCPLDVLEAREKERGDRQIGTARYQYDRVYANKNYDVEVDTSQMSVEECVSVIRGVVNSDTQPTAFNLLRTQIRSAGSRS